MGDGCGRSHINLHVLIRIIELFKKCDRTHIAWPGAERVKHLIFSRLSFLFTASRMLSPRKVVFYFYLILGDLNLAGGGGRFQAPGIG